MQTNDQTMEWVGRIAGTLTTVAFVPQVWRVVRTRNTRDLSLGTFALFCAGVALWLWYGAWLGSLPIMVANGATLALALVILAYKLKYG